MNVRVLTPCLIGAVLGAAPVAAQTQWDFEYAYRTVFDGHADDHLVHTENARKLQEPIPVSFWTPVSSGTQAIVRYRFTFPRATRALRLRAECAAFNYSAGVGESSIWGSTNGRDWVLLLDNPIPTHRIDSYMAFDGDLPASLVGASEIWIECRMLRHSGWYSGGGAQFSRMDTTSSRPETFALRAEYVDHPASYVAYRTSCPSSVGLPELSATPPRIGEPWTLTVTNLRPNTPGFLFFALSDAFFGINLLPLDLVSIGAPGCFVNVDTDPGKGTIQHILPSDGTGKASVVIGLPNDPAILGFTFYNQYVSLDAPATRPTGITTTNAGKGVIGS